MREIERVTRRLDRRLKPVAARISSVSSLRGGGVNPLGAAQVRGDCGPDSSAKPLFRRRHAFRASTIGFSQPAMPRRLSLVAYGMPLTATSRNCLLSDYRLPPSPVLARVPFVLFVPFVPSTAHGPHDFQFQNHSQQIKRR